MLDLQDLLLDLVADLRDEDDRVVVVEFGAHAAAEGEPGLLGEGWFRAIGEEGGQWRGQGEGTGNIWGEGNGKQGVR